MPQKLISMLDSGDARITGTCLHGGEYYYVIDDQKTRHVLVDELDITYLEADTTNGVVAEGAPTESADIVPQRVFWASLDGLRDDEMIGAYVTRSMYDKIKYGV